MISILINGKKITATEGTSLLEAARTIGIDIPAMCNNGELEHFTSCMICLVKDISTGSMLPSCSVKVREGMNIVTMDEEIAEARKTALELLLSEHVGDCEAPCRIACPAFMDIPYMNRLLATGQTDQALEVVLNDIALPGVLGRICPAPCEGACKRKPIDEAVSICLLKRAAADYATPIPPNKQSGSVTTDRKVAIIGSGPAGLAAAMYMQQKGIQAVVYDRNELPGGNLRYAIADDVLDKKILDYEIDGIRQSGVRFRQNHPVDKRAFEMLCKEYDAVVLATGDYNQAMDDWGLSNNGKQLLVKKGSYQTNIDKVFAIGNINRSMQLAIRSLAQGKEVAVAIKQLFDGKPVTGEGRFFNSTIGKLMEEEFQVYLQEGSTDKRQHAEKASKEGFSSEQVRIEAGRCLHCDCRKLDNCKLRDYSEEYMASKNRFKYTVRKPVKKLFQQEVLVYEPGKCIKCGICVRLTAKYDENFGFTFIGRGFDVEIGIPFDEDISKALEKTAHKVAEACPTGALSKMAVGC